MVIVIQFYSALDAGDGQRQAGLGADGSEHFAFSDGQDLEIRQRGDELLG